jgi:hypothetical protein
LGCSAAAVAGPGSSLAPGGVRITWPDAAPLHSRLAAGGITAATFPAYVDRVHQSNRQRVRQGDLDHLVFYALQSRHFTPAAPIEPALSAKAFVDSLGEREREAFLRSGRAPVSSVLPPVRARMTAFVRALGAPAGDPRLLYFRELTDAAFPDRRTRPDALLREYQRVMQFVYEKEFVAQRSADAADAVADLYRTRGLSTDTAVEAGCLVYVGLGVLKSLAPDRPVRRVLIVGPGLDLAPRTGLVEEGPPESYQPWAVIDALLALGLSRADDLEVIGADINPRVVGHLNAARAAPPALTLISGIREDEHVTFSTDYRSYFAQLGRAIGDASAADAIETSDGRLRKTVRVRPAVARVLRAAEIDIVTERLDDRPFDLIVATNILPYFDDVQLALAMTNVTAMLAPGGVFLHNESRPALQDITAALGLRFEQSRHVAIANVRGAPPLSDSIWLHRKRAGSPSD